MKWVRRILGPEDPHGKPVQCQRHGAGKATFGCRHFIDGTALLDFTANDSSNPWPDIWCEKCEGIRIHEGGAWNDSSEEFAGIGVLCHRCYEERRKAIAAGEGLAPDVAFAFRFQCGQCSEEHRGLPTWSVEHPDAFLLVSDAERAAATITSDTCVLGPDRFVRVTLEIPIRGARERMVFGVWGSLSVQNFDRYTRDPNVIHPPMTSYLSTELPHDLYPPTVLQTALLFTRGGGKRPLMVLFPNDHALAVEQQYGMTVERAQQITSLLLHRAP